MSCTSLDTFSPPPEVQRERCPQMLAGFMVPWFQDVIPSTEVRLRSDAGAAPHREVPLSADATACCLPPGQVEGSARLCASLGCCGCRPSGRTGRTSCAHKADGPIDIAPQAHAGSPRSFQLSCSESLGVVVPGSPGTCCGIATAVWGGGPPHLCVGHNTLCKASVTHPTHLVSWELQPSA